MRVPGRGRASVSRSLGEVADGESARRSEMETRGGSETLEGLRYLGAVGPLPLPGSDPGRACAVTVFAPKTLEVEGEWDVLVEWCQDRSWEAVEDEVGEASCSVLLVPELPDEDLGEGLRREMRENHPLPWIVLTRCVPRNVGRVDAWKGVAEVVWFEEGRDRLGAVVSELTEGDVLSWLARAAGGLGRGSADLTRALNRACGLVNPPRTVGGLCSRTGLKEARLRYLWKQCFPDGGPTPRELMEWLQVGWALRCRRQERSWGAVAKRMGIREDTLRTMLRRRTGLRPQEAASSAPEVLVGRVAAWWRGA